jgi:hypothetical protein
MAPSDPRVADLDRKVLARLKRAMPRVTVQIADSGQASPLGTAGEADYGEIVMTYRGRNATTRSPGTTGLDEPGYPLVADASNSAVWFYGVEPLAFAAAWWLAAGNRRIPWRRS